jgi:hypothetical protein
MRGYSWMDLYCQNCTNSSHFYKCFSRICFGEAYRWICSSCQFNKRSSSDGRYLLTYRTIVYWIKWKIQATSCSAMEKERLEESSISSFRCFLHRFAVFIIMLSFKSPELIMHVNAYWLVLVAKPRLFRPWHLSIYEIAIFALWYYWLRECNDAMETVLIFKPCSYIVHSLRFDLYYVLQKCHVNLVE